MDDLSGQTIKGYEFREQIGAGGFGAIYRAYQPVIDREVAVKIILPEHANQAEFIRRFETEAQLIARLEHPFIVPLFDYWRDPSGAYLVMRWLRGGSLTERLKEGALDLDTISKILDQITSALSIAHRNGVVHRDLKPDNILLDEDGNAYLTDFGIAQIAGHETEDDAISGSLRYMAPEQLKGEPPTPQIDHYSLGIMLYEMLTGEHPFTGQTASELITQHLTEPLPPLFELRPDLPDPLDAIIQTATDKDPGERYVAVQDVAQAFRAALGQVDRVEEAIDPATIPNPYKGLRAFQEADAADFFGRDDLVTRMAARLAENNARFLAVVGPSGSGKSSTVRAGLLPAIRRGTLPGSEDWFIADMLPGDDPMLQLEAALLGVASTPPAHLLDQLRSDPRGLLWAVDNLLSVSDNHLLLFIDQFEELFTLVESEAQRNHFLDSLRVAATDTASRLHIIVTLRADFTDRPLEYVEFGELMRQQMEFVLPLSPEEIERAITGPARRVGLEVDTDLVAAIVADVREEPGALPLLQHALTEVFERRDGSRLTLEAYQDSGGVLGALARRAEEVYTNLGPDEQTAARQILLRLVTLGEGTEDTRRRAARSELASIAQDIEAIQTVLDGFGRYRLLTFDVDLKTREPLVEVAHEALIREWERLRDWLDASRNDVRLQRTLGAAAAEWRKANQDRGYLMSGSRLAQYEDWAETSDLALTGNERVYLQASLIEREQQQAIEAQRQEREADLQRQAANRLRYLVGVMTIFLIVAVGLTAFAFGERNSAQEEANANATAQMIARQESNEAATAESEALSAQATSDANAIIARDESNEAATAEAQALSAQVEAEMNLLEAQIAQSLFLADSADQQVFAGNLQLGLNLALESLVQREIFVNPSSHRALFNAVERLTHQQAFASHQGPVFGAEWSTDESRILSWSADGSVRVWDAQNSRVLLTLRHDEMVRGAAWNADESKIISWSDDGSVRVWDAASGTEQLVLQHGDVAFMGVWNADETQILSWSADSTIRIWDALSGTEQLTLHHDDIVVGAEWSADERHILSWSFDHSVRIWDAANGKELLAVRHDNAVVGAVWSADERHILSWSYDETARVWDAVSGVELLNLLHDEILFRVNGAMWNNDETRILSWSTEDLIHVWDAQKGAELLTLQHGGEVFGAAWNVDETRILSWSDDGSVRVWDAADGSELLRLAHDGPVFAGWNDAEDKIFTVSNDGTARVWDAIRGDERLRLRHDAEVYSLEWTADETRLLTGSADGTARVWDAREERPTLRHEDAVDGTIWNHNETQILSWSRDGSARVWDAGSGEQRLLLRHNDEVTGAMWNADESQILSWSTDGTARLWDAVDGDEQLRLNHKGVAALVDGAMWNRDETLVLTWAFDGSIHVWDSINGQERLVLQHGGDFVGAAWNVDGSRILSWSGDASVRVWDAESGAELLMLRHPARVRGAMWNADESLILSWSTDGRIHTWDAVNGKQLLALNHSADVFGAVWNADESLILSASGDGSVRVWDAQDGRERLTLRHDDFVDGAAWNADESLILSWSGDDALRVWDAVSGQERLVLEHDGSVRGAVWNADESLILSWADDGTARVWVAADGQEQLILRHVDVVEGALWSEDEGQILSWTADGRIMVWQINLDSLLRTAEQQRIRPLSNDERQRFFLPTLEPPPTG